MLETVRVKKWLLLYSPMVDVIRKAVRRDRSMQEALVG